MSAKLTPEQAAALQGESSMEMVDPNSGKVFVLIEKSLFDTRSNARNVAGISRGVEDMQEGRGQPIEEARTQSLDRLKQQHG